MEASARTHTPEALTQAKHPYQLTATENVILRLNAVQIGLGGDNSWYRIIVHEPYLTPLTRDYDYAYILSPLSAKEERWKKQGQSAIIRKQKHRAVNAPCALPDVSVFDYKSVWSNGSTRRLLPSVHRRSRL